MLVQHFDGFFLDHIPLLRKLKLREVASVNYLIGSISQGNLDILTDPNIFYTFSKPYIEAGVGIENILKILRIDLIKRFRYTDHPNIVRYGFRFSIYLNF
jgi:hypothetical protein